MAFSGLSEPSVVRLHLPDDEARSQRVLWHPSLARRIACLVSLRTLFNPYMVNHSGLEIGGGDQDFDHLKTGCTIEISTRFLKRTIVQGSGNNTVAIDIRSAGVTI